MGVTSWFFPLVIKLVRRASCWRCLTPRIQLLTQNMMDVCEWMRHSEILSYLISHTFWVCFVHDSKSLCSANEFTISYKIRRWRCKGKGLTAEVQIWPGCPKALNSSVRLTQGMDSRQAGLHAAVALVTCSNEARVSTDTSKISLFFFHPLPLSQPFFLSSISSFHSLPLSNKTWPPARCWCHGCHRDRSLTAARLCNEREVRGRGNYGSLR